MSEDKPETTGLYRVSRREWMATREWRHGSGWHTRFAGIDKMLAEMGVAFRSPNWRNPPISQEARQRIEDRLARVPSVKA